MLQPPFVALLHHCKNTEKHAQEQLFTRLRLISLFPERPQECLFRPKRLHPALRYCVRTKGKSADLDQPGSCGKGQVYLEGAVDLLRAVDSVDFHLLYSGRVSFTPLLPEN